MEIYWYIYVYAVFMWLFVQLLPESSKRFYYGVSVYIPLFLISAFRSIDVGGDTGIYVHTFENIHGMNIDGFFINTMECGYILFNHIVAEISNDGQMILVATSFFVVFGLGLFLYRESDNFFLSTILFIGLGFYITFFTPIRQAMSAVIVLCAFSLYWNRNENIARLLVLISTTFHFSSIAFLPLFLFHINSVKKIILVTAPFILLGVFIHSYNDFVWLMLGLDDGGKYSHYWLTGKYVAESSIGIGVIKAMAMISIAVMVLHSIKIKTQEYNVEKYYSIAALLIISSVFSIMQYDIDLLSRIIHSFFLCVVLAIPFICKKKSQLVCYTIVIITTTMYYKYYLDVQASIYSTYRLDSVISSWF